MYILYKNIVYLMYIFIGRSLNIGLFDISFIFNEMSYLVILFETGNNTSVHLIHARHWQGAPIHKPYARPPPISNPENEDSLKELNLFIINLCQNTQLKSNLTTKQRTGLRSLLDKKDQFSISVSDKGGEFVVIPTQSQQDLTDHHLSNTTGVYEFVATTRRYQGTFRTIINPTTTSYRRQISALTDRLQSKCNSLWKHICSN